MLESSNCVPLNLTILFVTIFVGLNSVAETTPGKVVLPLPAKVVEFPPALNVIVSSKNCKKVSSSPICCNFAGI